MENKNTIIKIVAFSIILIICINCASKILRRKESYVRMADFINQEEDFDALFFGSSHVLNRNFSNAALG